MIKNILILTCCFICSFVMHSQWNFDASNPTVVSNETCTQYKATQVADGNGGVFVFWLDGRIEGCNSGSFFDVYGQHYNSNGDALWEVTGREILNYATSIVAFSVRRSQADGEMIIGAHSYSTVTTDSLRFQKLDDNGARMWANDLLVANADGCSGYYMLGFENFSFYRGANEYVVNFTPTYCGGSDGNRITRFNSSGILTGLYNGEPEGNQYYVGSRGIDDTYDGTNDTYLYYTGGNGAGAHAFCMRVTAAGDSAWAPIDVLEGTNGLSYQYLALSDANGITFCFQSTGSTNTVDCFMRRLNNDGSWAWGGAIIPICEIDGYQNNLFMVQDENYVYACWADGRPGVVGNYAVYAQKVDKTNGEMQWGVNGTEIFDQNNYSTNPKCVLRGDGKLVVITQSGNPELGLNAQLVNPDGTTVWTQTAMIAIPNFLPFYEQYEVINSDENIVVVWNRSNPSGGADGVYIAKVKAPATQVSETVSACGTYTSNGETFTQSGIYIQELPGDTLLTLDLTITSVEAQSILNNDEFTALNTEGTFSWFNCSTETIEAQNVSTFQPTSTGEYALIVELNGCMDTSACALVIVISVSEFLDKNDLQIFPNPNNGNFQISGIPNNATCTIYDSKGRYVDSFKPTVNQLMYLTQSYASGLYTLEVISDHKKQTVRFAIE